MEIEIEKKTQNRNNKSAGWSVWSEDEEFYSSIVQISVDSC